MTRIRIGLVALVTAGLCALLLLPSDAPAALRGTPGYSGTLSSNAAIRKQQLICDPEDPVIGSGSTQYDPRFATVSRIDPWRNSTFDGYSLNAAYVEVSSEGPSPVLVSVPVGQDFSLPNQTGYLQVVFQATTAPFGGITGPYPGYDFRARNGVDGQNTHSLIFDISPNVPLTQDIVYRNYADAGGRPLAAGGVSQPDTLQSATLGPIGPAGIAEAVIAGPLVPEPSTGLLLAGAGSLLAARRRRRRRPRL